MAVHCAQLCTLRQRSGPIRRRARVLAATHEGVTVAAYEIVGEPSQTPLSQLMTNPFWAVLATMLGGVWLGWSWFVLNSLAIGSMHRKKEIATVVLGLLGSMGFTLLGLWAVQQGRLDAKLLPYATTLLIAWKLAISYLIQFWQ